MLIRRHIAGQRIRAFTARFLLVVFVPTWLSADAPFDERGQLRIKDGGYRRDFEVALDEVHVRDDIDSRFVRIAPRFSAGDARNYARIRERDTQEEVSLVLYEVGVERNAYTRRILTRRVTARVCQGADPSVIASGVNASGYTLPAHAPGYVIFSAAQSGESPDLAERLRRHPDVQLAEPLLRRLRQKRYLPDDELFPKQWHLRNTGQGGGMPGVDVRVTNVWAQGYFGDGVLIGVVDDGLQYTHPDLSLNYVAAYSRNWNGPPGDDYDPAPNVNSGGGGDAHGTSCAGIAAARGHNEIGVSGVAPLAGLAGLRLIAQDADDAEEAEAMAYSNQHIHVKSNSWGPTDDGLTLEAPGPLTRAALSNSVITGRNGLGTIFVWAGGNGRLSQDNANYDGFANSIYTISVPAVNDLGRQAAYSEPGACHVVAAPSGSGYAGIVTTDLVGESGYNFTGAAGELADLDYTQWFDGTSASTPIVAGVIALMLEANPLLGWRDVQEILIRTARQIHPADEDWSINDAGLTFNHKYGSGLVNADGAVNAAESWNTLGPHIRVSSNQPHLHQPIPDNDPEGVTTLFHIDTPMRVEHVTVTVDIEHPYRGDLTITLTSPGGMTSTLAETRFDYNDDYTNWTFMTTRKWGENAEGTWTLHIADLLSDDMGTLQAATLDIYGADFPDASDLPPILFPINDRTVEVGTPVEFDVVARDPVDYDWVTLSAAGVPFWATFPARGGPGGITNTFTARFPFTGVYPILFRAEDKDGFVEEPVTITVIAPPDVMLSTGFNTGLPDGWSVTTNAHPDAYWRFEVSFGTGNLTGGSGIYAVADSYHAGTVNMDTELRTPVLNCSAYDEVLLSFRTYFEVHSGNEFADVDVSANGDAGPWHNVWRRQYDFGILDGALVDLDLSSWAAGQSNVLIRFRYHNANWDWFWQVDDVTVTASARVRHDSDGDGIPDEWEIEHFGDLSTANAFSDYSENGVLDIHEFLAGTDPRDPNSALRIEHMETRPDGSYVLEWQSASNRSYRVTRSSDLISFAPVSTNIPATPPLNILTNLPPPDAGPHIYRIELEWDW